MAMCSYQALARYDDDCSTRKYRARNLDDIRVTHREAVLRARLQLKCLKMLQNRRTLADILFDDDLDHHHDDEHDDDHESSTNYNIPSSAYDDDDADYNSEAATECSSPPYSEAGSHSPAWSLATSSSSCCSSSGASNWPSGHDYSHHYSSSSSSSSVVINSLQDLPESFLETGPLHASPTQQRQRSSAAATTATNRVGGNRSSHAALYKQSGFASSNNKSSSSIFCDSMKTRRAFEDFMNLIKQCPVTAPNYSHLIGNSWQILLQAIQDPGTGKEAIDFLAKVCQRNLLTPEMLVNLIQHGLHYSLCNAIYSVDQATALVCELLEIMITTQPAIIAYLVEVMVGSKLFEELKDRVTLGSNDETRAIIRFFHLLTETILGYKDQPPQPLMPQVLLATGVSQHTLNSYSPKSTMEKYLTPQLIRSVVSKCLARTYSKQEYDLNLTMELLANVVKLAFSSDNEQWVVGTLCCLRDLRISDKMNSLIKSLARLAKTNESSEHCSQGVGLDSSTPRLQERCAQFQSFYKQYYEYLATGYAQQMAACESDHLAASGAGPASGDSWILD